MIIQKKGKWIAKCDDCGFESRRPRKGPNDKPKWWSGDPQHYLYCAKCEDEILEALGEEETAAWS